MTVHFLGHTVRGERKRILRIGQLTGIAFIRLEIHRIVEVIRMLIELKKIYNGCGLNVDVQITAFKFVEVKSPNDLNLKKTSGYDLITGKIFERTTRQGHAKFISNAILK